MAAVKDTHRWVQLVRVPAIHGWRHKRALPARLFPLRRQSYCCKGASSPYTGYGGSDAGCQNLLPAVSCYQYLPDGEPYKAMFRSVSFFFLARKYDPEMFLLVQYCTRFLYSRTSLY